MPPNDLVHLVTYVVATIGEVLSAVGQAFIDDADNIYRMTLLTRGIFGENGGLIYWCNEKLLWMLEQMLEGLTFTL